VPQNRSGRRGEEKHLSPARNPTPTVHPYARRNATDTAVKRMECTLLHIYLSLDFKVKVTLRPTTSRSVRRSFEVHVGLMTVY
jgi:hypothetical protein